MPSDKARNTEDRLNQMIPYVYGTLNTNTASITGLNTRLGSNTQQTYLGTLGEMSTLTPLSSANSAVVMPGSYSQGAAQTAINSAVDDAVNLVINKLNSLITELRNSNYMT